MVVKEKGGWVVESVVIKLAGRRELADGADGADGDWFATRCSGRIYDGRGGGCARKRNWGATEMTAEVASGRW